MELMVKVWCKILYDKVQVFFGERFFLVYFLSISVVSVEGVLKVLEKNE